MIRTQANREWHLCVGPVYRTRTRIYQVRYFPVAAFFQHLQETEDVGRNVRIRPFQRVSHARLRSQMDYPVEIAAGEQLIRGLGVREGRPNELERPMFMQQRQPLSLEPHVIVTVNRTEAHHFVMVSEKATRDMEPNKARRTGHKNPHLIDSGCGWKKASHNLMQRVPRRRVCSGRAGTAG